MWIIRLVVDESMLQDVYKILKSENLFFDIKYIIPQITLYIKVNDVIKGLEMVKKLSQHFKTKFDNTIYEALPPRRLMPQD